MGIHESISPKNRTESGSIAHKTVSEPLLCGKISEFRTRN